MNLGFWSMELDSSPIVMNLLGNMISVVKRYVLGFENNGGSIKVSFYDYDLFYDVAFICCFANLWTF